MVKKKDTLVEEAEKIKVDLDKLKKKKKILDSTSAKKGIKRVDAKRAKKNEKQSGTCKGICKKFKAKRPSNGKRYDSGQGRCQICEQWIDYHGAHVKNNIPATENSIGWYCNCCNYRIRLKPRNKMYKEILAADIAEKKVKFESINQNPCPKCGIKPTADNIQSIFGMRVSGEKSIRQSQCHTCRATKSLQTSGNDVMKQTEKISIDKINRLISDASFLIRKNSSGIYENVLMHELMISENEFKQILPKLIRLEDIVEESEDWDDGVPKKVLRSVIVKGRKISDVDKLREETKEIEKQSSDRVEKKKIKKQANYGNVVESTKENEGNVEFFKGIKDIKNNVKNDYNIENECQKLIRNYKNRTSISEHNIGLMEDMIEGYAQIGSLRKLCQEAELDISIVRNGFRNLSRVPTELRKLVVDDKLIADPILAVEIAVYATDYFEWDQEEEITNEVIKFAKNIAQKFKDTLELRSEFFATKDDYSKPISASSKKNSELNAILEDWPVKISKYAFNRFTDRTGRQYNFIVKFSKDMDAARFLRRWEYEKGRRISKKWASEMIDQIKNQGNAKEFVKDHSNEFND